MTKRIQLTALARDHDLALPPFVGPVQSRFLPVIETVQKF